MQYNGCLEFAGLLQKFQEEDEDRYTQSMPRERIVTETSIIYLEVVVRE